MKIDWLRCFLAVEKYRNFSVAADSLFMTQSSLSKQLKSLEEELDLQLFERSTHVVKLTQAGEKVIPHAQWIVGENDRMRHDLDDLKIISRNKISLAAPFGMSYYDITDMVIDFEQKHPNIIAETHEKDHDYMIYFLDSHIVDFCIGYQEFWANPERYCIYPLYEDSIVIVLDRSHPMASLKEFTLADAQDTMFCLPREDSGFFQLFLGMCNDAGFSPRLTLSDVRISTIKRYINYGMRLTVTSALRASIYFKDPSFCHITIKGAPTITLVLATRNERLDPLQKEFITHAQRWYKKEPLIL